MDAKVLEEERTLQSSYKEVYAYDNRGQLVQQWQGEAANHHTNWMAAVVSRDRSTLNADTLEGHLSSSLCLAGAISHQLGEKRSAAEIADFVKGNPLLSNSFDRMASHLRANDVDIDSKQGRFAWGLGWQSIRRPNCLSATKRRTSCEVAPSNVRGLLCLI